MTWYMDRTVKSISRFRKKVVLEVSREYEERIIRSMKKCRETSLTLFSKDISLEGNEWPWLEEYKWRPNVNFGELL